VGKTLGIIIIWAAVLGGGALAYKYFIIDQAEIPSDGNKNKDTDTDSLPKIKLALDSFSGYCIFRSPEFKKRLAKSGFDFEYADDKADYAKRMETIKSGDTPLAVFTIDALIANTPRDGEPPATTVMLIDETRGADAMIAYKQGAKDINALNHEKARIVLTEGSPSETLFRVVRSQFDLNQLPKEKKKYIIPADPDKGAEDVYTKFLNANRMDRQAFVLWEPYVSLALKERSGEAQILVDSSKFKGFIVDVLVVQQKYLREHPERVEKVVRTYLECLHDQQRLKSGMAELVLADAKIIGEEKINDLPTAEGVAKGIWWKNTVENYAHFGMLSPADSGGLQPIGEMIERITKVLDKTKEPNDPSPGLNRPDKLVNQSVLQKLDKLHLNDETIFKDEIADGMLTELDWNSLKEIGSFEVPEITFSTANRDQLTEDAREELAALANRLRPWPQYYLRIEGNTASEGDPDANKALAARRAAAVQAYLVEEQNFGKNRFKAVAMKPGQGKKVRITALQKP
jgi:outer membrane protein OmpA-like peptidoglycan-associated protein